MFGGIMGEFSIGQGVTRKEDWRLLTGQGLFLDDMAFGRVLYAVVVRSPHAHAEVNNININEALSSPGVNTILTGEDYLSDGLGPIPSMPPYKKRDGSPMFVPDRPAIALDMVRNIGYPVAVVVAETVEQAKDAAELIEINYTPLPAVISAYDAFQPEAPQLYEGCPGNESYFYEVGDEVAVKSAFASAEHVVQQRLVINRVTANAIETRGVVGHYDNGTGRYTLYSGFQRPYFFRKDIAQITLKIPETQLRLVTGDIGGSYGLRGSIYPEMILMLWAAKRVGRPVKWQADRSESHISDDDGRDNIVDASLALDKDGFFLGAKFRSWGNLGSAVSFRGALPPAVHIGTAVGVYNIPAAYAQISGMLTNTHSTSPYRGAGRPEASYMIERLVELAAVKLSIDSTELRRCNYIKPSEMPFKTALTYTYDNGEFEKNMDLAMRLADWEGFEERKGESAGRGKLRGIGMSNTIEHAADAGIETSEIRFDPGGAVTIVSGAISHGQGHYTTQTQILVDQLGVDPELVNYIQGDTDKVAFGVGTGGSRSTTMSGGAIVSVSNKILKKALKLAAHLLESSEEDINFSEGIFKVVGTDRMLGIHEVARASFEVSKLPTYMEPGLYETATYRSPGGNFPNGCHICELEVDPETGFVDVLGYFVVDDVGTVVNPLLLEGQIMGGISQGMGQVLMEDKTYDANTGQVLSGSFMDYSMPRADDFCGFVIENNAVPTSMNPLGVKGAGEAGAVGALSAGVNAIVDSLSIYGISHIDTPATPYRIWQAIQRACAET